MDDKDELTATRDIPPWLQPVPEAEEEGGFFANKRGTLIAAGAAVALLTVFIVAIVTLYDSAPPAEPRRVTADTSPIRERPENPGGREVAFQDKQVFDAAAGVRTGGSVSLGPQPEQPVEDIPDLPEEPISQAGIDDTENDSIGDIAEAALEGDSLKKDASSTQQAVQQKPVTQPAPEKTAPKTQPAPAENKNQFRVQLGAYGSEEGAASAWRAARGKFPRELADLSPSYEAVVSGDRTLYRLRLGPIATREAADQVCIALRAQQQACIVVNPG